MTYIRTMKRTLSKQASRLRHQVYLELKAGQTIPPPKQSGPNVFSPGPDGTWWGSELLDKRLVADQLDDMVYYLARALDLPN